MKKIRAAIRKEHGDAILEAYYNDRPMRLADLKTMAADPLVHIGSHSHHHIAFHAGQDPAVGKENIEHSIHLLRDVWKVSEQPAFCFPHGDWTAEWASCLRHLGVPIAFPDAKGFVEDDMDPLLLPRFWMKSRDRMLGVLGMSLVGNRSLYAFGREPPPKLAARVQ